MQTSFWDSFGWFLLGFPRICLLRPCDVLCVPGFSGILPAALCCKSSSHSGLWHMIVVVPFRFWSGFHRKTPRACEPEESSALAVCTSCRLIVMAVDTPGHQGSACLRSACTEERILCMNTTAFLCEDVRVFVASVCCRRSPSSWHFADDCDRACSRFEATAYPALLGAYSPKKKLHKSLCAYTMPT